MQRPVIASLDGTEKDARAVAVAKAIASLADADLRVLRVVDVPPNRLLMSKTASAACARTSGKTTARWKSS